MKRLLVLALLLGGCGDPMHPRAYPRWVAAEGDVRWADCVGMRLWVRKSGKAGLGATLEVRSKQDCATRLHATLTLDDGTRSAADLDVALKGRSLQYAWLPFHFDGDAAWNAGARRGVIEIAGAQFPITVEWHGAFP